MNNSDGIGDIKIHEQDFDDICMEPKIEFVDDLKLNETEDDVKEKEEDEVEEEEADNDNEDDGDDEEWMHGKRSTSKKPKITTPKPRVPKNFFELPHLKDVKLSPLQSFEQLGAQIPTYKQVLER